MDKATKRLLVFLNTIDCLSKVHEVFPCTNGFGFTIEFGHIYQSGGMIMREELIDATLKTVQAYLRQHFPNHDWQFKEASASYCMSYVFVGRYKNERISRIESCIRKAVRVRKVPEITPYNENHSQNISGYRFKFIGTVEERATLMKELSRTLPMANIHFFYEGSPNSRTEYIACISRDETPYEFLRFYGAISSYNVSGFPYDFTVRYREYPGKEKTLVERGQKIQEVLEGLTRRYPDYTFTYAPMNSYHTKFRVIGTRKE